MRRTVISFVGFPFILALACAWGTSTARAQEAPAGDAAVAAETGGSEPAPADTPEKKKPAGRPRHQVVVRQVATDGQVYYIAEQANQEDQPATGLKVQVLPPDGGERVFETTTDDQGKFRLPLLDEGKYLLIVGLLKLDMNVIEPVELGSGQTAAPKTLLLMIPRNLGESQQEGWTPPLRGRKPATEPAAGETAPAPSE